MSETNFQNMLSLLDSIDQHYTMVEERVRHAGMEPDPAVVQSVAKYWEALEKLAAE